MSIEIYINFLCNALVGGDPTAVDDYCKENKEAIDHYADLMNKKHPVTLKKIYRGLLLLDDESINQTLLPKDIIQYISFSESKEVAQDFANTNSTVSQFFMGQCPDARGYLVEHEPDSNEILFHYSWAEALGLDMTFGKGSMKVIQEQQEVMLKQTMKEFKLTSV